MVYYFDYASTTPVDPKILEVYNHVTKDYFMNPGNNKKANKLSNETKNYICKLFAVENTHDLIYTSGGTEANNLAIIGYADNFQSKKHFITTCVEHSSVYESFKKLEQLGHEVTYLKLDKNHQIPLSEVYEAIQSKTVMISIMTINNELGDVLNVDEIFNAIKKTNSDIVTMTDAVQALGKVKLNYDNCDLVCYSAHKIHSIKGIGILLKKKNLQITKLMHGGNYEHNLRAGTQDLASQVALASSIKKTLENSEQNKKKNQILVQYTSNKLKEKLNAEINSINSQNIVNFSLKSRKTAQSIVDLLADEEIYLSTFSACSSTKNKGSRILESLDFPLEKQMRSLRISFTPETTLSEIDYLVDKIYEKTYEKE